jgi:predicted ATPase
MLRYQAALPIGATDPFFFWGLAHVYWEAGRQREDLQAVGRGFEQLRRAGNRWFDAELLRLKGELLLLSDGSETEAIQCFREAMEMARQQNAKSWELRATTSLARFLAKQGRRDEAHAALAEIYDWFTQGFDTADLKYARRLLDEVSNWRGE